jgi:hypothetical protein
LCGLIKFIYCTIRDKYFLGRKTWLKQIGKKIKIPLSSEITERKKYYSTKISQKKLKQELKKFEKTEQEYIKIYIMNKYTSMSMQQIKEELNLKTKNSGYQKLYRLRDRIKRRRKFRKKIEKLENKILTKC